MDIRIKNALGIVGIAALSIITIAVAVGAYVISQVNDPTERRTFSVSAEGKAIAVPDVAQFTFQVITEGGLDIAELQQTNVQKVNGAIAFIKEKGVEEKDIKTQSFNVEPRYQYVNCSSLRTIGEPCPPAEIVGHTIRQVISVKVRNFEAVGTLLSGVVQNGANSVSQLSFTVDDPEAVENEARADAVAKAKRKAEEVANAGDFRIGKLISINEGGGVQPFRSYYAEDSAVLGVGGGTSAPVPAPSIEPGSQDIIIYVTLVYEIK
ncbi:MAG: hypothetical protein COU90_02740 [Candidatus Ryanbacteria bacterium CG10_big_fil_rev_8_21_14_0_10_43_42]|uniref:SIMPL domain-containing protein n=1 Tax=Candidatus Ryanbacteria bacterium CG10_big_fil_rev_8_21_14_0_10_43_42 TaxID=1974864 RepID=A0A2M8KWN1_9BACT|nr:MAG: hypothetical protein COU90_02740 [Candidatus Ryanbacteria bacterium CG10_big_fil_rev_8_21_14_0_10_43_42]